jgi:putative ATPase
VTLVGATTENPYFEVNSALLSRAQVYELHALSAADVEGLLRRALDGGECGDVAVDDDAVTFLAARSGGDARAGLNALELACETVARTGEDGGRVTVADAEDAMQRKAVLYDKDGDQHFDFISAWIKSTRGSDPDASLYYLAAMLEGGEDPRYIARRMIVLASEDIGNADPHALPLAIAASQAVEHVGFPECQFALAQAAIYLSLAPKSNAVKRAILSARAHIAEQGSEAAPNPLRSAAFPAARRTGRGVGYENPHDEPGHVNDQEHLPPGREALRFYAPDDAEPALRERLAELRRARGRKP